VEAVVFCGVQGSGKTTFFRQRFFDTHVRVNLDMLRTRRREAILVDACIRASQRFVVDNTNPTVDDRRRYVAPAIRAGFRVIGYWFDVPLGEAIERNGGRSGRERVLVKSVLGTFRRLEPLSYDEGFDELYRVRPGPERSFIVDAVTRPPGSVVPGSDPSTGRGRA